MRLSFLPMRARFLLHLLCLAGLANAAYAQGIRPGASARGGATAGRAGAARGGATGAGTANRGGTGASSGPRQYRSNTQLGDAIIQIDPETKSIVIVTGEDTHREMVGVIRELDKPKPQVLIKVVFLEVTYNKGYDVGVEGSYTFNFKNPVNTPSNTQNVVNTVNNGVPLGTVASTSNPASPTVTTTATTNAALTTLGNSASTLSQFGLAA